MNKEECFPKFDPEPWDDKIFEWNKKRFIKEKVFTIIYVPINFGGVMKKAMKKIDTANAKCVDWMGLSDHTSKWNMDVYIAVDKEIPDVENVTLSGRFLSKVYEGPFKDTAKWCKDFEADAKDRNLNIKKTVYVVYYLPKKHEKIREKLRCNNRRGRLK